MAETGKYIVIEGGEYVGKTTQARILANSIDAVSVREPGATPIGESVRDLLLDAKLDMSPSTEVLLHAAARAQLAATVIGPELANGRHVVSDRNWLSGAVYQSVQGVRIEDIEAINKFAIGDYMKPDLLLILDADTDKISSRAPPQKDYYEKLDGNFHPQVREKYLKIGIALGAIVIDAEAEVKVVAQEVSEVVKSQLNLPANQTE